MPLSVTCPNCEKTLRLKDDSAGRKVRCPDCSTAISVPTQPDDDIHEEVSPRPKRRAVTEDNDELGDAPVSKSRARKSSKKKSSRSKAGGPNWLLIGGLGIGGIVALLFVAMLVAAIGQASKTKANNAANLEATEKHRVQADARAIYSALYSGDADTLLRLTNPKVIEQLGGMAKAKPGLESMLEKLQGLGMTVESISFPNDPTFIHTASNQYVLIPTLAVLKARNGQRVESLSFQLGARATGATAWTYLDGSQINKASVKTYFSDFPPDQAFPSTSRKKL